MITMLLVTIFSWGGLMFQWGEAPYLKKTRGSKLSPREYALWFLFWPLRLVYYVSRYMVWPVMKGTYKVLKEDKWIDE